MTNGHNVLTPEEAAEFLRVNPQTVYRHLRRGKLPGVKIGHQWRISKSELEAYLKGKRGRVEPVKDENELWLGADLSGELPPYEWGPEGEPKGKPVRYIPGKGLVVEGGKRSGN